MNHHLRIFFRINSILDDTDMYAFCCDNFKNFILRDVGHYSQVTMIQFEKQEDKHLFQLLFQDLIDKGFEISEHYAFNLNLWVDEFC